MLQHTLDVFAAHPQIARIAVIISSEDEWFDDTIRLPANAAVYRVGGATRAHTVANGLHTLLQQQHLSPDTIVLVHDAARCCLPVAALNRLLDALPNCPDGAILAVPVADTLKQQDDNHRIVHTVPREGLWQAQTPQAFRAGSLHLALQSADLQQVTDEASAMERAGYAPRLIEGDTRNIKRAGCFLTGAVTLSPLLREGTREAVHPNRHRKFNGRAWRIAAIPTLWGFRPH